MKLSQFKFKLPDDRIAMHPSENRDECRLMVVDSRDGSIKHCIFKEIINFFNEKDVFVFNDTRVFRRVFSATRRRLTLKLKCFCCVN